MGIREWLLRMLGGSDNAAGGRNKINSNKVDLVGETNIDASKRVLRDLALTRLPQVIMAWVFALMVLFIMVPVWDVCDDEPLHTFTYQVGNVTSSLYYETYDGTAATISQTEMANRSMTIICNTGDVGRCLAYHDKWRSRIVTAADVFYGLLGVIYTFSFFAHLLDCVRHMSASNGKWPWHRFWLAVRNLIVSLEGLWVVSALRWTALYVLWRNEDARDYDSMQDLTNTVFATGLCLLIFRVGDVIHAWWMHSSPTSTALATLENTVSGTDVGKAGVCSTTRNHIHDERMQQSRHMLLFLIFALVMTGTAYHTLGETTLIGGNHTHTCNNVAKLTVTPDGDAESVLIAHTTNASLYGLYATWSANGQTETFQWTRDHGLSGDYAIVAYTFFALLWCFDIGTIFRLFSVTMGMMQSEIKTLASVKNIIASPLDALGEAGIILSRVYWLFMRFGFGVCLLLIIITADKDHEALQGDGLKSIVTIMFVVCLMHAFVETYKFFQTATGARAEVRNEDRPYSENVKSRVGSRTASTTGGAAGTLTNGLTRRTNGAS
jgi:hypothetical protein